MFRRVLSKIIRPAFVTRSLSRSLTTRSKWSEQNRTFRWSHVLSVGTVLGLTGSGIQRCTGINEEKSKPIQKTKAWHYYSGKGPKTELENLRLISGNGNRKLSEEIAGYLGVELSEAMVQKYADGEIAVQVKDNIRGQHVYIVQSMSEPVNDNLMELLLLCSACARASAESITVIVPYFGYGRQDRMQNKRVPISAADVALMLNTMAVDRMIAIDLHTGQIEGFFPPEVPVDNLPSVPVGAALFAEKELTRPTVVALGAGAVDRAKRFRHCLVNYYDIADSRLAIVIDGSGSTDESFHQVVQSSEDPLLIASNKNPTKQMHVADGDGHVRVVGDVRDNDCILISDMVDTGQTLTRGAKALKEHGANQVYAFATHGIFSYPFSKVFSVADIEQLVVSNTLPMPPKIASMDHIKQVTLAPLLAEALRRVHNNQSVSILYKNDPKLLKKTQHKKQ